MLDAQEIKRILKVRCDQAGGITAWAQRNGFTRAFVSKVINGKEPVTDKLAKQLGYRTVPMYETIW